MSEQCLISEGRGKALIADDDSSISFILRKHLKNLGYQIVMAENGQQAIELYKRESPDIIFMDIWMPVLDGLAAAKEIKLLTGDDFIPIIFMTSVRDDAELAKCLEVGGDDYIIKPFNAVLLKARINAMERIRHLHTTIQKQHNILLHEQQMAEGIFNDVVMANNVELDNIRSMLKPAVTFSGDLLLTARSPSGDLYVLMGDFTGHGLAAAIGAFPASQIFQDIEKKGFSPSHILAEMNSKLYQILPADMFFAACLISISPTTQSAAIWNGGLPDVLIVRPAEQRIVHRVKSEHLALGIVESDDNKVAYIEVEPADEIFVITDGVTEAVNMQGEEYGEQRLERILCSTTESPFDELVRDHEKFVSGADQYDDISLISIPCATYLEEYKTEPSLAYDNALKSSKPYTSGGTDWVWSCELGANSLKIMDPIPVLLGQLQEFKGLQKHRQSLYTILAELYNNALDHGILRLDSSLKHSAEGFAEYFELREKRMEEITDASIKIRFEKVDASDNVTRLNISVEDSGDGFDYDDYISSLSRQDIPTGRGIKLIEELCETVRYLDKGNKVEAVYTWQE